MDIELYHFPGSNSCVTTTLLLDYAGIEYRSKQLRPAFHVFSLKARRFPGQTVPAARIDGRKVQGSINIAHAVAAARPELQLLPPKGTAEHARMLELERDGERLQNAIRRIVYVLAIDDISAVRSLVAANSRRLPAPLHTVTARVLRRVAAWGHRATPARIERDLERTAQLLDRFDVLVEEGVLGTDQPNVADFQIAPNLAIMAGAPHLGEVLRQRPSWKIAERLLPTYPLAGSLTVPASWVKRLSA